MKYNVGDILKVNTKYVDTGAIRIVGTDPSTRHPQRTDFWDYMFLAFDPNEERDIGSEVFTVTEKELEEEWLLPATFLPSVRPTEGKIWGES